MKLTQVMFERVGRRKGYRLVRWSRGGDFYLAVVGGGRVASLCGVPFGPGPERYVPEEHPEAQLCGVCWDFFTGEVREIRRLL